MRPTRGASSATGALPRRRAPIGSAGGKGESMIASAREFFDELGRAQGEVAPCASATLEGTCRLELAGNGTFHLRVAGGRIAACQPTAHPDCVLRMSEQDFVELVTGRRN